MKRTLLLLALLSGAGTGAGQVHARTIVDASPAENLSVTLYRDPDRASDAPMEQSWPQGFAMISETRTVTLPSGESTIRFAGVAEGMVAVSAIVTGLPGGTIEKNRNADLLSPGALVDGTLGNHVRITRTNPASGATQSEDAVIRTRADGGLVIQTQSGYEAVRCSGLPEKLTFDKIPDGLSSSPVFSIDTQDGKGGTYTVTLTYLAWGFDWQANYVATLAGPPDGANVTMHLRSWLSLLNDNGQSFTDSQVLAVAGRLNVDSDYQALSDPPRAEPLLLTCYPLGSTSDPSAPSIPAPSPKASTFAGSEIMVTAREMVMADMAAPSAPMMATQEDLGDLKLYRVPEAVTVNAKGLKQVAFLDQPKVEGTLFYTFTCAPMTVSHKSPQSTSLALSTKNDKAHGLGVAMPMGGITIFEPSAYGDLLLGEQSLRDYAVGQDVEIALGESSQVSGQCLRKNQKSPEDANGSRLDEMEAVISNANNRKANVRLILGPASDWSVEKIKNTRVKDGNIITEITVPAGKTRKIGWVTRRSDAAIK